MGSLIKSHLLENLNQNDNTRNISPDSIYHISIMPCYDKKLEASRSDFYNDVYRTRDVDSTGEVERILKDQGLTLTDVAEGPLSSM